MNIDCLTTDEKLILTSDIVAGIFMEQLLELTTVDREEIIQFAHLSTWQIIFSMTEAEMKDHINSRRKYLTRQIQIFNRERLTSQNLKTASLDECNRFW